MTAAWPSKQRSSGERVNARRAGIDLGREAAIPGHEDVAVLVDLTDDTAIAGAQARVVARRLDELDPRPDRDTGPDPSREKPCTLRIHTSDIGFTGSDLYPPRESDLGRSRAGVGEVAPSRRIAPNSTA